MDVETVVLLRPGASTTTDRYSDPIPGADTEIPVDGCQFAPTSTAEPIEQGRNPVPSEGDVYAPPGTVVYPTDRARIRGDEWQVDGQPGDWTTSGVVFHVRRVPG